MKTLADYKGLLASLRIMQQQTTIKTWKRQLARCIVHAQRQIRRLESKALVLFLLGVLLLAGCSAGVRGDLYYPAPRDPATSRAATHNTWPQLGDAK